MGTLVERSVRLQLLRSKTFDLGTFKEAANLEATRLRTGIIN